MTQYVQQKVASMERPVTVWILIGVAFALLFSYAYFVNGAIMNIVASKDMQAKISVLTSSVGDLESAYLAAKSTVTIEYARSLGFSEAKAGSYSYIAKKSASPLTFNR